MNDFNDDDFSHDALLDGRITLAQARNGYRVAIDPVFLAASVCARAGQHVLDLGCGSAAASLCLAARVVDLNITGLELQPEMRDLAQRNITANNLDACIKVMDGDVAAPPPALKDGSFDHVMSNPPFMASGAGNMPTDPVRATAMVEGDAALDVWIALAARVLRHKGTLSLVHRADRLGDILSMLQGRFGGVVVYPLLPGPGLSKPAKRILVQARKGLNAPLSLQPGMVLHNADGSYTSEAQAILRHGAALSMNTPES